MTPKNENNGYEMRLSVLFSSSLRGFSEFFIVTGEFANETPGAARTAPERPLENIVSHALLK